MARIPNSSEASSMWKMNDVYVAENGGEWPPTYVPYSSAQNFIRRGSGTWGALTDGTTTNAWPWTNPGTAYTSGTTANYYNSGYNCDAISFYVESNYATTYKITHFGYGLLQNISVDSNNNTYILRINSGRGLNGTILYERSYPTYNFAWFGYTYSVGNAGYAVQTLALPATDSTNRVIPSLTVGTNQWYTVAMGWGSGGEGSMYNFGGASWDYNSGTGRYERTITTGGGTVTMVFDTPYFNGGGLWNNSRGTNNSAGQFQILGVDV
jgi:hypothetical protein